MYPPETILEETGKRLRLLDRADYPDYLTFVADGEPTLDKRLGESIRLLKGFEIPVAVITNGTLLGDPEVAEALSEADWVSLKADTADNETWKKINRPCKTLELEDMHASYKRFAEMFEGILVTETMLVSGVNDATDTIKETADFISTLDPLVSYISVPVRPPAVQSAVMPERSDIESARDIFLKVLPNVVLLDKFEGAETGYTGDAVQDITAMCAVHPMREDTMARLLGKDNAGEDTVDRLLREGKIKKTCYRSHTFYLKK